MKPSAGLPVPWEHPAVVGKHVVSMTRDYVANETFSVATCQCGWCSRVDLAEDPRLIDQNKAVFLHWRDAIDRYVEATKRKRRAA